MITHGFRVALAVFLVAAVPRLAAAGPLQDCCSSKGGFCVLPLVGGAAGCRAAGGQFFRANACLRTLECAVAHQLPATGRVTVRIDTPQGPLHDMIPLDGALDVVETELLKLDLQGVGPVLGSTTLKKDPAKPAPGLLTPPGTFPADSFFDVFYEIELPNLGVLRNAQPQRIGAAVNTFPPLGVPYVSAGPVPLFDADGQPAGELEELVLTFLPPPDGDGDGVVDSGDLCAATAAGAAVDDDGCSVAQRCPCPAHTHGEHVSCVVRTAWRFLVAGLIRPRQFIALVIEAAQTRCTGATPTPAATPTATASRPPTASPPPNTPPASPTPSVTPSPGATGTASNGP